MARGSNSTIKQKEPKEAKAERMKQREINKAARLQARKYVIPGIFGTLALLFCLFAMMYGFHGTKLDKRSAAAFRDQPWSNANKEGIASLMAEAMANKLMSEQDVMDAAQEVLKNREEEMADMNEEEKELYRQQNQQVKELLQKVKVEQERLAKLQDDDATPIEEQV